MRGNSSIVKTVQNLLSSVNISYA